MKHLQVKEKGRRLIDFSDCSSWMQQNAEEIERNMENIVKITGKLKIRKNN